MVAYGSSCSRFVVLAAVAAAVAVAVAAQEASLFTPIGDFEVLVGGTPDEQAAVYQSQSSAAVLVVSGRLPSPVLLHAGSQNVQAVPQERLVRRGEALGLTRGGPLEDLGRFEVEGTQVQFRHGSVSGTLRPKPPLVGEHSLDELFEHSPGYRTAAQSYSPRQEILSKLRSVGGEYRVRVVFGSWCSVCKRYLPRGLKVHEELAAGPVRFEYFGLPLEDPWEHAEVERLEVKALPTAIVYREGEEIGRFAGAEGWEQPEVSLWKTISRAEP